MDGRAVDATGEIARCTRWTTKRHWNLGLAATRTLGLAAWHSDDEGNACMERCVTWGRLCSSALGRE